jgi:hypothetical protein
MITHFEWPQFVVVVWLVFSAGFEMALHGKKIELEANALRSIVTRTLTFTILYAGGFFG